MKALPPYRIPDPKDRNLGTVRLFTSIMLPSGGVPKEGFTCPAGAVLPIERAALGTNSTDLASRIIALGRRRLDTLLPLPGAHTVGDAVMEVARVYDRVYTG